jgi:hypothetical protein
MKTEFPFPHHIIEEKKQVWIVCSSSITAIGIPSLMKQYFPDYHPCLCNNDYFQQLIGE